MLKKKVHLIVSSGPTKSWIDPVRFISNASSGQMGFCLAQVGTQYFQKTSYICSTAAKEEFQQVKKANNILVESTLDMYNAILSLLTRKTNFTMHTYYGSSSFRL